MANLLDFEEYTGAQLDLSSPPPADPPLSPERPAEKNRNFWTVEYYQKYFDVDTSDVLQRIKASIIAKKSPVSYYDQIRNKPDLYGPFWISTTLIFTIAISGNIANYLQYANKTFHWKYDFHLVSYAATAILCYTWLVPLIIWGVLKWTIVEDTTELANEEEKPTPSIITLFCIYGYSLSIYVPVSILWTIQVYWLQWLLVIIAALLSGIVLVYILQPILKRSKHYFIIAACILSFHFLLAAGFKLYFFHVPAAEIINHAVAVPPIVVNSTLITHKP